MKITFDPTKRALALDERGLDFADAPDVFTGVTVDQQDDRVDYGEARTVTVGLLAGRMVVIVWTERDGGRRIISMRKANAREQAKYKDRLGRP